MRTIKLLLALILFVGFSTVTYSQKPDKESLTKKYDYTQLPTDPLPNNLKAFLLEVKAYNDNPEKRDIIYSNFNFAGFEKKRSGSTDFTILIEEYPLSSGKKYKMVESKKKKDGVEKKVISYNFSYYVKYKLSLRMLDGSGEEIYSKIVDMGKSGTTPNKNTAKEARDYANVKISQYKSGITEDATRKLAYILNNKFGYPVKKKRLIIYKAKGKKYNYEDFDKAYELALEAVKIVEKDENNTEECFKAYQPAIALWQTALEESNIKKRKSRVNKKITCACYYNIANAYLLCKDYDKAIENFNEVIEIKEKFSNAKSLIKFTKDLKRRAEANQ